MKSQPSIDIRQLKQNGQLSEEIKTAREIENKEQKQYNGIQELNISANSFLFSKSTQNYFTPNKSIFTSFKRELNENTRLHDLLHVENERQRLLVQLKHNQREMRQIRENLFNQQKSNNFKLIQEAQQVEKKTLDLKTKIRSYKRTSNYVYAEEELVYMDTRQRETVESSPRSNNKNYKTEQEQDDEIKNQNKNSLGEQETNYYFYCSKVDINSFTSPGFREGATLTYINGCLYLYGGLGEDIRREVHQFDLKTKVWKKLDYADECYPIHGMFGHTAVSYKDSQMIVYGGQSQFNSKLKARQCYNEVWGFDVSSREWQTITGFGSIPEQRRNHCTVMKDNLMITFGGVSGHENYLSDIQTLNLDRTGNNFQIDQGRWKNFEYDSIFHDGIAYHKMASVFIPKNQNRTKKRQNVLLDRLKDEGVYCYGGKNKKGKIYNQMMVLRFTKATPSSNLQIMLEREDPDQWQTIQTNGKSPPPRFDHSMDYIENINSLVVFGGIGESSNKLSNVYFNDLWIFKISTQIWVQINLGFQDNIYRSGHASCVVGSQIFFFGGLQETQYSNCFLYHIETDSLNSYKLKRVNEGDEWVKDQYQSKGSDNKKRSILKEGNQQHEIKQQILNQAQQVQLLEQAKQAASNDEIYSQTKFPSSMRSFMPLPSKMQLKQLHPREQYNTQESSPYNSRRIKSISTQQPPQIEQRNLSSYTSNQPGTPDSKALLSPVSFEKTGNLDSYRKDKNINKLRKKIISQIFNTLQFQQPYYYKIAGKFSIFKSPSKSVAQMNTTQKLFPTIH